MSERPNAKDDAANMGPTRNEARKFVSERGPFEICADTKLNPPIPRESLGSSEAEAQIADFFEHSALAAKVGEKAAREKVVEMYRAISPGTSTTTLFAQKRRGGMSLMHSWFGPNFPLFRHSHPRLGDCLYFVLAGEILLGSRRLGAGSRFFVPNGQPYKYIAGPEGAEVLEFRAGGGERGQPGMKLDETSLDAMQRIIDGARATEDAWEPPEHVGDSAHGKPPRA